MPYVQFKQITKLHVVQGPGVSSAEGQQCNPPSPRLLLSFNQTSVCFLFHNRRWCIVVLWTSSKAGMKFEAKRGSCIKGNHQNLKQIYPDLFLFFSGEGLRQSTFCCAEPIQLCTVNEFSVPVFSKPALLTHQHAVTQTQS